MTSGGWPVRVHAAAATIAWCCALNAAWIAGTLLGGIVLGIGPATVTACILSRRRMRGESIRLRDFVLTWRREVRRGSVVMLPVVGVAVLLLVDYAFFTTLGPGANAARLATLVALVAVIGAGAYVGPMYAFYDIALRAYGVRAMRFALGRPASTIILLLVFTTLAFATAAMPVLLFTISIGIWLQTSTWLGVRFFTENEDRLADEAQPGPRQPIQVLPSEPLRIR